MKQFGVGLVSFVPDSGLSKLITLCQRDDAINTVTLSTEEEGVALSAGAYLGGMKSVLLMQSSGVGNCVNMLSLPRVCNMPFVTLVAMRGEWGEFNPWQIPMGQGAAAILERAGLIVYRVDGTDDVAATVEAALELSSRSRARIAILLSQRLLGAKRFQQTHQ